ncbi:HYC_CC_PP family protein [Autumnicola tepida]
MQSFNKIIAISLVFAVMFASSSFTVNMHFCCNKLVDMAVFAKAQVCDNSIKGQTNSLKECSFEKKGCCDNKSFVKEGSDNFQKTSFEMENQNLVFLHTFFYAYVNLFEGLEQNIVPFLNYDPPLIPKDFQVLHEVYLI